INRPSLYSAYGNKEALFRKVMDRYGEGPSAYFQQALEEPTARRVVEKLIQSTLGMMADASNPRGCLLVQSALCGGDEAAAVCQEATERRLQAQKMLEARFKRARKEGDLPTGTDAADLARYIMIVLHGLSVQAASGASCEEMRRAAKLALTAVPE